MSYIKHKEKLFTKKSRIPFKKRSDCNLRKVSSCNDVRAWSLSDDDRRQYFIDHTTSRTSTCKYIPPDIIVDIINMLNIKKSKKSGALKKCNSEQFTKNKFISMASKRSRLCLHTNKNKDVTCNADRLQTKLELNNLQDVVDGLESNGSINKSLKEENAILKSQINLSIEKIKKVPNIGLKLSKDIGLVSHVEVGEQLCGAIDLIKNEWDKMRSDVIYLQEKNAILCKRLKLSSSSERMLQNKALLVSLETVNNAVLKRKLSSMDHKVQRLANLFQEQRSYIENLLCQINDLEMTFSWKEEVLHGKLSEYKDIIKFSSVRTLEYENKLALSYSIIQETDVLKELFRKLNLTLTENAVFYKTHLRGVTLKALEMASKIEWLLKEVAKRDDKIKALSRFPGRSCMAIRLIQLDNIVNGDFIYEKNKNTVVETFIRLKKILKDLKKEALDDFGFERPFLLSEISTQTILIEFNNSSIQTTVSTSHTDTQTEFPDEYLIKYVLFNICLHIFMKVLSKTKQSFFDEKLININLIKQVKEVSEKLDTAVFEVNALKSHNDCLRDKVIALSYKNEENKVNDSLNVKCFEYERGFYESLYDHLSVSLMITIKEYEDYCSFLEHIVLSKEELFKEMAEQGKNELDLLREDCFRNLKILEKKNEMLIESLNNESIVNNILLSKIELLNSNLDQREDLLDIVINHWMGSITIQEKYESRKEMIDCCCEVDSKMIDSDYTTTSLHKMLEVERKPLTRKKIETSKNQFLEQTKLKKKLYQVNIRVKKIKKYFTTFKSKLELSVETLKKLKESNIRLLDVNRKLNRDNSRLNDKVHKLRDIIFYLKNNLQSMFLNNTAMQNKQVDLIHDYQQLQSEHELLKESRNKQYSDHSANTDVVMYNYEQMLNSKDECITQLKLRVEKLIELLKEIENEKKYKEENYVENFCQSDNDLESQNKYIILLKNVKEEYSEIICNLKNQFVIDMDAKEQHFRNNLALLKDTYERDIKRIKVANADSLRKIQCFHEDEIRSIKMSIQERVTDKTDFKHIQDNHIIEMEQLRNKYEKMLEERIRLFSVEKENIQKELKKYMFEKEAQVKEITNKMDEDMKNMKKKCKVYIKKIKKDNNLALEQLKKEYSPNEAEDRSSVDLTDLKLNLKETNDFGTIEYSECPKQNNDLVEVRSSTSGFEEDLYDSVMVDERRFLLKRIAMLEEKLSEKQRHSSENACDSEKRVWKERERCREISKLLEKEVQRNEKLKIKLNELNDRADHLAIVNQALLSQMQMLENKRLDKNPCRLFGKEDIDKINYNGLFNCYDSNKDSDYLGNRYGTVNFSY